MKRFYTLVSLFLPVLLQAQQNLVLNPSFEDTVKCPDNDGQIYNAKNWFQPITFMGSVITSSTTDYFNECSNNPDVSVPNNFAGHQYARTGVAYAGFILYYGTWREYIEAKLNAPLIAAKKYCVDFYLSLGDSSINAISSIGLYFSKDSILTDSILLLPYQPQVKNSDSNFIKDKVNWTLVSGEFTAIGGEQFITIGNFNDDAHTSILYVGGGSFDGAYYYIDDVSVYYCDSDTVDTTVILQIPNVFSPNNDGVNDVFKIKTNAIEELDCAIYNRWGERVYGWQGMGGGWDGKTNYGTDAPEGVYYYVVSANGRDGKKITKKGFMELKR